MGAGYMGHTEAIRSAERLPEVSGRSFGSSGELIEGVLRLLVQQLGMRSCALARVGREEGRHEILAAYNLPGGCNVLVGHVSELHQTF